MIVNNPQKAKQKLKTWFQSVFNEPLNMISDILLLLMSSLSAIHSRACLCRISSTLHFLFQNYHMGCSCFLCFHCAAKTCKSTSHHYNNLRMFSRAYHFVNHDSTQYDDKSKKKWRDYFRLKYTTLILSWIFGFIINTFWSIENLLKGAFSSMSFKVSNLIYNECCPNLRQCLVSVDNTAIGAICNCLYCF